MVAGAEPDGETAADHRLPAVVAPKERPLPPGPDEHGVERHRRRDVAPNRGLDIVLDALPHPKSTVAFGLDRPLYYSVHTAAAKLAPEGQVLASLAKYLAPGDDGADADKEMEDMLDIVQPGWRAHVLQRRFLPALVVTNAHVTAAQGGLAGRPPVAMPARPGVFLAGDWVGPEGMLSDASFASGKRAAELAVASARRERTEFFAQAVA